MLRDFGVEIGASFGPLKGKVWRIGSMGYNARKDAVLITLAALEAALATEKAKCPRGAGVDAASAVYRETEKSL
jgi:(S)-ureidoglycine-glyoxylate aminotransferase